MSTINIGDISNATFKVGAVDCSIYLGDVKLYPKGFDGKYKLTLSDSTVVTADCDSTSAITSAETSAYTNTLVSAEIGDCVTNIGYNAFGYSTYLTSVTIPNSVTSIGDYAFQNCSNLTSVTIPDSVTSIGNGTFVYCTSLTSINIPSGVTSIGGYTFNHCTSLTSINIPSGVTSIGGWALSDCSSLASITVEADTPPTLASHAFDNTNNCPIYIPCHSTDAYTADTNWNEYASRFVEYGCSRLPDGYTEVEYIENTASVKNVQRTSFLSIAFADSVTDNASAYTYTVAFESTEYPQTYNCLFGNSYIKSQPLGSSYNRIAIKFVKYGGDTAIGAVVVGKKYETKVYWNEGESYPKIEVKDITADTTTTTAFNRSISLTNNSNKIGLFNLYNVNDTSAYTSKAKIYEVKIEDRQGNLVAHGIPCVRTSDNKCGFYNLARNEFEYDQSGQLSLTAGPQVEN